MSNPAPMEVYPMRVPPGGEVTSLLQKFVTDLDLKAAFIVSCVGSVKRVILRFATDADGNHAISDKDENLEICSLVGTVSKDGYHLHGTFGNAQGTTLSGHVMGNMVVQTTAEIVIGNASGFEFQRKFDDRTGFRELEVREAGPTDDEIKTLVANILEGANLEEITMKRVCQQVYDNYPDHDLAPKKDFIKDTVRSLIST